MWALFSHSWRTWRHAPAVAILAVSALALGVTATTAIYTIIQAVLLNPLPYANPDRYLTVLSKWRGIGEGSWSYLNCIDFERRNRTMAALGCISNQAENLAIGKQTHYAEGRGVTPSLIYKPWGRLWRWGLGLPALPRTCTPRSSRIACGVSSERLAT